MVHSKAIYQFERDQNSSVISSEGGTPSKINPTPDFDLQHVDAVGAESLMIALIGPNELHRKAAANALAECLGSQVREFSSYPPSLDDVPRLLEENYDVVIIDLETDPEYAIKLIESVGANGSTTVMVYSATTDSDLLVRCMRAGAREFLTLPFSGNTFAKALARSSARRPAFRAPRKPIGKLLGFLGAKGGAGVTTVACNYAVALAQASGQSALLIDLDLPLGDAVLNLGIASEYSTVDALRDFRRLDSSLLAKFVVKHSSGLSVLAAPGKFPQSQSSDEAIDKLLSVARRRFDNVVVDMGSRLDLTGTQLFKDAFRIYLVTQSSISELRNSNRLITHLFSSGGPTLEVVVNRFETRSPVLSEEQITKALTRPVDWKIPNDHAAVRKMQSTATPLVLGDTPISKMICQMANSICPQPDAPAKKKGFRLFG